MKNIFLPFLLLNCLAGSAQNSTPYASLQSTIDSLLIRYKIPGAQAVIVNRDTIMWKHNFGLADVENQLPVTDQSLFRIGSVTKSFVALSVMQLVEQHKLSLSDKLSDLAPEIPFVNPWKDSQPLRLVHLLEHTTGWDDLHFIEYATNGDGWTTLQGLQFHPDSKISRWPPGEHFSYCNAGPPAAAFVVEKITGETIEDYIGEQIFQPLNMPHSSLLRTPYVAQHLSKGYFGDQNTEVPYWHIIDRSAGSINSNATEMAHYLQMFLNRGKRDSIRIVASSSIDRMEVPQTTLAGQDGAGEGYGLHISSHYFKGVKVCGHSGGMAGFLTMINYLPEKGIGYFFSINKNGNGFRQINQAILNHLIDPDSSWQQPVAETSGYSPTLPGFYRSATSRNQMLRFLDWIPGVVQLYEENDTLFYKELLGGEPSVMYVIDDHTMRNYNKDGGATLVKYLRDHRDREILQAVAYGENLYKTSGIAAWGGIVLTLVCLLLMISALLLSLVWIPLWLFQKRSIRYKRARLYPLLGSLSFVALVIFFLTGAEIGDVLTNLGNTSIFSVGMCIASILLAIFTALSIGSSYHSLQLSMHRAARVHAILTSVALLFVTAYLAYWGVIGLQTWSY